MSTPRTPGVLALLGLVTVLAQSALAASQLIGVDWGSYKMYDIDKNTAATSNPRLVTDGTAGTGYGWFIAVSPINDKLFGLAMRADDVNVGNLFYKIDAATGAATLRGTLPSSPINIEGDIGFDPTTGVLYALNGGAHGNELYTVNTSNGSMTYVGTLADAGDYSAMAFDPAGNLYAIDTMGERLSAVDKSNGSIISMIPSYVPSLGVAGLAFDPDTGVLYYATTKLYTINTTTGAVTLVGNFSYSFPNMATLSFDSGPVDPCAPVNSLTINTGWNQTPGNTLPVGGVDNEWMAVSDPDPATTEPRPAFVIAPNPAWSPAQANSQWVSSYPTAEHDQNGHYVFAFRFCLQSNLDAFLNLSVRADDAATVYLNGNNMGTTGEHSFDHPPLVVATTSADFAKFKTGPNTVTVDVQNIYNVAMGFNLTGTITGQIPQYHYCCTDSACGVFGVVWYDPDYSKQQEAGESGLASRTVRLYQNSTVVATTTTDNLGNYYFMDLPPGTYKVAPTAPGFFNMFTTPSSATMTLDLGDIVPNQNFGIAHVRFSRTDPVRFYQDPFTPLVQPNPFNPEATISFTLEQPMRVSMKIYNVAGQLVKTLVDENMATGGHKLTWDGRNEFGQTTASGIYFLRTVTPNGVNTQKLMMLK